MESVGSLEERIASRLESLSPKHKQIARFLLGNRYFMSVVSANQAGERNGTSAATVVRFAQALGYEGYPELQEALRAELPTYITAVTRMQKRMHAENPPTSTPHEVFYTDIRNIEQTASGLPEENLNAAVDAILAARRTVVIGAGLSSAPAAFLSHSLRVMGFDVLEVHGEGLHAAVELSQIRPGDLLIAIDLWRYVRMTVNAISHAKEAGARVLVITDSAVSPLTQKADVALEVATQGVAHSLSIVALISLLNVIVALLADRAPDQVYEALQRVDAQYRSNDLLLTE